MPWMACGPGRPPESTGDARRLDRHDPHVGQLRLQDLAHAGDGPAGADAGHEGVERGPSTASRISSAVVRRWTSGLAGFSNCCGMNAAPGARARAPRRRRPRPLIPSIGGREVDLGAEARAAGAGARRSCPPAWSGSAGSPCTAATMASPMPVLPLVGSTIVAPGLSTPRRSASSTIATAIRSFTLPPGLRDSTLTSTRAARRVGQPLEPHQSECHRSGPAPSSRSCQP